MNAWQNCSLGLVCAVLLAACATPVASNIKVSEAHTAKYSELSALDVVATLEKNVNEAKSANMPFLAPNYFREAAQVLSECQSALGNQTKDVLVSNAAKGEAILEKGREVMAIVQYRFAKELELKSQLDEHSAAKLLPKDYEKVTGDFSKLIEKVEREQPDNIDKEKESLLKEMLDLVIKAVQESALHESEVINADNKKKNADKQVPITYADALKVYQEAKTQIAAAHHDKKLVQRLGQEALFAAHHAQQVNDRVALLQTQLKISSSGSVALSATTATVAAASSETQVENKPAAAEKVTLEKIVLQEEERLQGIATALGIKDLRDQSLEKQVEEIKRAATEATHRPDGEAIKRDFETRLKAANDATQQLGTELNTKDQQIAEKDKQLAAQTTQLSEKDAQIKQQKERIDKLEWEKPAPPVKKLKPTAKAKDAAKK